MTELAERPIALVGLMGAGKSATAHALGERLGAAVADLDAMLVAESGRTIAEWFASDGEPAFRRHEGVLLRRALAAGARVIACGGGIVLDPENRRVLAAECRVVWLEVTAAEAARRLRLDAVERPLLAGQAPEPALAQVLAERRDLYAALAHQRVATDGLTPEQVAIAVIGGSHAA
ncbi:MAG: shikimate kinase [Candidatus Eisenbacteria bacterium]|uniref:Shikimate kinase n=1 Tax=Eiseniibacteriota bacterium TaxID=2212470 RepID=A0A849SM93_UNCEI|nr:shikimate kinase [Candidatus Eisenbacteria bacterium]